MLARGLSRNAPEGPWWPFEDRFTVALSALLTQRTRWEGAARAVANLEAAGLLTAAALAAAPRGQVERALRPAGFYRQKARAVQAAARRLCERFGGRFEGMLELDDGALRRELLSWRGVGEETADAVMVYAAGRPGFIVDAYTLRVMRRFGALRRGARPTYAQVAAAWARAGEDAVERSRALHAAVVELSKEHCRAQPLCGGCPLGRSCMKVGVPGLAGVDSEGPRRVGGRRSRAGAAQGRRAPVEGRGRAWAHGPTGPVILRAIRAANHAPTDTTTKRRFPRRSARRSPSGPPLNQTPVRRPSNRPKRARIRTSIRGPVRSPAHIRPSPRPLPCAGGRAAAPTVR